MIDNRKKEYPYDLELSVSDRQLGEININELFDTARNLLPGG